MAMDDLVGAVWLPGDGKANPTDLTQSLAKGTRNRGARIIERVRVTGITVKDGTVRGVETDRGDIAAEIVVNCAGQWARKVGLMCGVTVPLHSAEHMYIVTGKIEGVHPDLPVLRDPDGYIYFKEEVGGLVMGGFEPEAKPWGMNGIPDDFEFALLADDWDQFEILMQNALVPCRSSKQPKSGNSTTARRASRRTIISFSARRRNCGISMSAQASTPWASPARGAPGGLSPNGSSTVRRRWTSGRSTFAASRASTTTRAGCTTG